MALFSRFRQHIIGHDWFAVTVDFLIVVVGIFAAMQADNWNEARKDRLQEREYLLRLYEDASRSVATNEDQRQYLLSHAVLAGHVLASLKQCAVPDSRKDEFATGLYQLGKLFPPYMANGTIEELRQALSQPSDESTWPILYGANIDDLGDFRPGMEAAREASIQAPYVELNFDKKTIRSICAHYRLEVAQKPAMPCMASRIAYGESVTVEKLNQVEKAEDFLYDLGLRVLRVRHHGQTARIEVPLQDFATILAHQKRISEKLHELGFVYISLDLDGFKSGSLNAVL